MNKTVLGMISNLKNISNSLIWSSLRKPSLSLSDNSSLGDLSKIFHEEVQIFWEQICNEIVGYQNWTFHTILL